MVKPKQGLGNAYLPAAILVLAGSLARPSLPSPRVEATLSSTTTKIAETKAAFFKKVRVQLLVSCKII